MKLSEFDYELPPELIAQHPADRRDSSRLLVLQKENGVLRHQIFSDLPNFLRPGDLLVMNNSKVFPARLFGHKPSTGGRVEILLSQQLDAYTWEVIGKGLRPGVRIEFAGSPLRASVTHKDNRFFHLLFNMSGEMFFDELEKIGHIPLPPYIHRIGNPDEELQDRERYQTIYAKDRGSVAAPTAGLHFTPGLLSELRDNGVQTAEVTLHVGLGTFASVETEEIERHKMHKEYYTISYKVIQKIIEAKKSGGRVIAVGTTSARVLETVFQRGLDQFGKIEAAADDIQGQTQIFIYPPYEFQCIDGLITNFHLPKSSLIMLVSALAGKESISKAYKEAIREHYRFFSYGDAMLII